MVRSTLTRSAGTRVTCASRTSAVPGIAATRLRSLSANVYASCSRPGALTTCKSMGAGKPKFNTWVEMSGGKKKNVDSGYTSFSFLRSCRT